MTPRHVAMHLQKKEEERWGRLVRDKKLMKPFIKADFDLWACCRAPCAPVRSCGTAVRSAWVCGGICARGGRAAGMRGRGCALGFAQMTNLLLHVSLTCGCAPLDRTAA